MRFGTLFLAAAFAALPAVGHAASFSEIISFGDSLSDPGNASIATLGAVPGPGYATRPVPVPPFSAGYFTNPQVGSGPAGLWVDQLAGKLGVADPQPFLAGGTNFAIASADTSAGIASMNLQLGLFFAGTGGAAPSNALYTLWGGANDIFDQLNPVSAADTIASQIQALHAAGGQSFLWLNLPSLGETPGLITDATKSAAANAASAAFNLRWSADLAMLQAMGIDVIGVDVNSLFVNILANPAAYGFTNVTSACMLTAGCNPNTFLYWDLEHPTTYADSLVANLAYSDLTATPEPGSVTLVGIGAVLGCWLVFTRRRALQSA